MELVRYDAMCRAISECHSVDEVQDLHNKALALELYARQAKNTDAERKACEVRLRAERRAGDLYADMERSPTANGGDVKSESARSDCAPISEYRAALDRTGVSERTAQRWQQLASVDERVFEEALRAPEKPSTNAILKKSSAPAQKMNLDSLWIWGRARDFERERFREKSINELLEGMTDTMRADMERIAPIMADFFNELAEAVSYERA